MTELEERFKSGCCNTAFKNITNAAETISGIELARNIRKGQFNTLAVIASEGARVSRV